MLFVLDEAGDPVKASKQYTTFICSQSFFSFYYRLYSQMIRDLNEIDQKVVVPLFLDNTVA